MPSLTEKKILPYSAKQIYSLVMDIEKYPEFLPWCKQSKIIEVISDKNLVADLLINFKNFFEKYRSDVKHGIDENGDYFVDVIAIEGPFKYLSNRWKFKKVSDTFLNSNSYHTEILPCHPELLFCHPELLFCHPERSEGSPASSEILRCAQDDKKEAQNDRQRIQDDSQTCEIEFFIEFQFNSFILEKMLGGIFEKATKKMMLAFEERAKVVFGKI